MDDCKGELKLKTRKRRENQKKSMGILQYYFYWMIVLTVILFAGCFHLYKKVGTLNEQQRLKMIELEKRLESLECEEFHPVQPYTTYSKFLNSNTTSIVNFEIPRNIIPDNAKSIEFQFFVRTGAEGPSRYFNFHVWTKKGVTDYKKTIRAFRYQQDAISFDDQKIWLPFDHNFRNLYCQMDSQQDIQAKNCHGCYIHISGWK